MKLIFVLAAFCAFCMSEPTQALEYRLGYTGGNCSTCSWIAADGEIAEGDAQRLLEHIKINKIDYEKLIVINSGGGNVSAAIELGKLVRQRGMRVIVGKTTEYEPEGAGRAFQAYEGGICASACVFVLMGGAEREIAEESVVGVHQFAPMVDQVGSIASTTSMAQNIVAMLQAYAISMGVDPVILTLASSISPDDMLWLEPEQMERLGLLTTRNYKSEAEWELRPVGSQLVARAWQEQNNGRTTGIVLACRSLHVFFEVTSKRSDEIAKSIKGAKLTMDHTRWSLPLTIVDVAVRDGFIHVVFEGGSHVLGVIARANGSLNIDIGMPFVYYEEFGGFEHDIPTSNIAEMTPHIVSSCG